ncbi:hypothetical protein M9458_055408 [Cirrhinus mrigala]|uniref:Uncharacterized protein n=1 Tax=Cirrhinus mrigala TaxID=683832 RepID=A0ABD0MK89_CIRMR
MGETRAPIIRRPPRARESQENHRRDNRGPHPEKGRGGPGGGSSGSHNADVPGGRGGKPAGSAGSRPHQSRPAPGPGDPRAPHPLAGAQQGQGGQAPPSNRRERASARPSSPPRSEKPPTHRRPGASSTGRAWWHHHPQRGNQRQTPELNPLRSGVETGRPPRSPAAAEKTTSPDPDRMASSEQRTGVALKQGEGQDTNHPPPARVKSAPPQGPSMSMCNLKLRNRPPDAIQSTTSPASQRHTRTPKPYLYVGVMEREKGSIRDGEEIIGGGKAPPLPQICPGQGAQALPDQGSRQPGAAHQTPQQRKNYPHPIIQSTPKLQKAIDTQVKSVLRLYWNPKNPKNPKPPPDLPRSSTAARPATYVRRHRPPQQRRMQPPEKHHPRATNTPSRPGPQPQRRTPQGTHL